MKPETLCPGCVPRRQASWAWTRPCAEDRASKSGGCDEGWPDQEAGSGRLLGRRGAGEVGGGGGVGVGGSVYANTRVLDLALQLVT